jgi:hypothetical protein
MNTRGHPPGLIQRYREALQARHNARRTVNSYEQWLRRCCFSIGLYWSGIWN